MASYLFDTNCFLRLAENNSPERTIVLNALRKLRAGREDICCTPQIIAEFWNVCTRPVTARGGLGLSVAQTERKTNLIQKHFRLLTDNFNTFTEWRNLVSTYQVTGVQVHDTKLAASMIVHKIQFLVTFNERDLQRFPMITVVNPTNI
jgi:predicted nucleic acid-binding protein